MNWISWGAVFGVGLVAGAAGAFLYSQRAPLQRLAAPRLRRLRHRLALAMRRPQPAPEAPPPQHRPSEDAVVLMPDGRPWPLGPAVQLLEMAWRWQVVHGTNLPLRARQGEGAYVWRPPLPARTSSDQPGAEAER